MTTTTHPLQLGTTVYFKIAGDMFAGTAVIQASQYDEGWLYRLEVTAGDQADIQRNEHGELWVCDFEVEPQTL